MLNLSIWERILMAIDETPWDAIHRALLAFGILAAWSRWGLTGHDWSVVPFFLAVLLIVRFLPTVIRKAIPFPPGAQAAWAERRRLAGLYDSYQWRKLLWFGLGLAIYLLAFGGGPRPQFLLAAACLIAGGAGWLRFQRLHVRTSHRSSQHDAQLVARY